MKSIAWIGVIVAVASVLTLTLVPLAKAGPETCIGGTHCSGRI